MSAVTTLGSNGVNGAVELDPALIDHLANFDGDWTDSDEARAAAILAGVKASILDPRRLFTPYQVRGQFRNKVMGGIPRNPQVIQAWLRSKMGVTDEEEIRNMVIKTLQEQGVELTGTEDLDALFKASENLADTKSTNGFKFDDKGIYLETRQGKAMLKEGCNVLYAGERWGVTKKGPKNFLAERVFLAGDKMYLMRDGQHITEPDGVEMVIGHVSGPQGPRSTLTYHQYCIGAEFEFEVMSANDCITEEQWAELLTLVQEGGLGALRSQGHGRWNVYDLARVVVDPKKVGKFSIRKVKE